MGAQSSDFLKEWNKRPVYWATLSYLRWWWATDGVRLARVRNENGFTADNLRNMAVEYNVMRGVVSGPKDGRSLDGICKLLNSKVSKWPNGLIERANFCEALLEHAMKKKWVRNRQISLITKAMWFLRPDGWTPFDRYAANGLGIPRLAQPCRRMALFYTVLERRGFLDLVRSIQLLIDETELVGLPAARVIDTLLMVRGGRNRTDDPTSAPKAFVGLLPQDTKNIVEALASDLQGRFGRLEVLSEHPIDPVPRKYSRTHAAL